MLLRYPGLAPSNVNKDAKYSVVHSASGRMEIRLIYRVSQVEKALLTTDRHDRLVGMVNEVKDELNGVGGGVFYINEYGDVLVPDRSGGCVFGGTYDELLKFDFGGKEISPVPPSGLNPGDPWSGPHVGIRYVLTAGAADIKYELTSGQIRREHYLSHVVGQAPARLLARRLAAVKGQQGGRIYINEAGHFFAWPTGDDQDTSRVYLGSLEDDAWFPAPDVPGRD